MIPVGFVVGFVFGFVIDMFYLSGKKKCMKKIKSILIKMVIMMVSGTLQEQKGKNSQNDNNNNNKTMLTKVMKFACIENAQRRELE